MKSTFWFVPIAILTLTTLSMAQGQVQADFPYPPDNNGLLYAADTSDWLRSGPSSAEIAMDATQLDNLFSTYEESQVIVDMPELPELQGWYHYLGVEQNAASLKLRIDGILVESYDHRWVFDRLDGRKIADSSKFQDYGSNYSYPSLETWQTRNPGQMQPVAILGDELASMPEDLLQRPDSTVLKHDANGLWLATGKSGDSFGRPFYHHIELYDPEDASLIDSWRIPLTYLVLGGDLESDDPLVLVGDGVVNLFHGDGSVTEFCSIGGAVITAADYDGDNLVLFAMPYPGNMQFANVSQDPALADGSSLIRKYSLDSAEIIWEARPPELIGNPVLSLQHESGYILSRWQYGFTVHSAEDGSLLFNQDDSTDYRLAQYAQSSPAGIYWSGRFRGDQRSLELFDPVTGSHDRLEELASLYVLDALLAGNRLYVLAETRPTGHDYWSANNHLFCLQLDSDGNLLEGELAIAAAPPDYSEFAVRFMGLEDPSLDTELMNQFISTGINAFRPLLDRAEQMSPVQLDSMALLAAYMSPPPDPSQYFPRYDSTDSLIAWLVNNGSESLTDDMLRWMEAESLYWMQFTGPGIIAACGGDDAKHWLDEFYAPLISEPGSQPEHSMVDLDPLKSFVGDIFQPDGPASQNWHAMVETGNGGRLMAYVADGLSSERDIFLAIDADADGTWDEILPTGLVHTYFYMRHPGGPIRVDPDEDGFNGKPSRPIELAAEGDTITIGHYVPVNETVEYDYTDQGGPKGSQVEMTSARFVSSDLDLSVLRLDSDEDGLSDIAEGLMLIDPFNPDTDNDGINDYSDRNPLVDSSSLGLEERAASRSIAFFGNYNHGFAQWWRSKMFNQPLCARYIVTEGDLGPLVYSGQPGTWNICLIDSQLQEKYEDQLQGYNSFNRISVSMGLEIQIGSNKLGALTTLGPEFPAAAGELVHINMALQGQYIPLAEINGEFYPITVVSSWIS